MELYEKIIFGCLCGVIVLTTVQILLTIYVILGGRLG